MGVTGNEWKPATAGEQKLKENLQALVSSNSSGIVQVTDSDGSAEKFVLNSHAYFDLRNYVMTAKDFPKDNAAFAQLLPRASFKLIDDNDPTVYITTQDLMVNIGNLSSDFVMNKIEKMGTIASDTVAYATTAIGYMEENDKVNLKRYLGIILDEKYAESNSIEDRKLFSSAVKAARQVLSLLKRQADKNKAGTDELSQSLRTFYHLTKEHKQKMDYLLKQYRDAPVTKGSKIPYLTYLFGERQKTVDDLVSKIKQRENKRRDWTGYTTAAYTTWFLGTMGFMSAAYAASKAANLDADIKKLNETIQDLQNEAAADGVLITEINKLLFQCDGIFGKMQAAIDAANNLSTLFGNQSNLYAQIGSSLDCFEDGVGCEDADMRRDFIEDATGKFTADLKKLRKLATDFHETMSQPPVKV